MRQEHIPTEEGIGRTLAEDRRRTRGRTILTLILILGVSGVYAWRTYLRISREPAGPQYVTEVLDRGDLEITVSATGTLEPVTTVDVGVEVSGTIAAVEVDFNDHVSVGQVLARLDTSILEAKRLQSQAALEAAEAKLGQVKATVEEARRQMARMDELSASSAGKLPARTEYDAQQAALKRALAEERSAVASVHQSQAALDVDDSNLTKAVIVAPINGIVLDRLVEPGQTVAAQLQTPVLFTLAEDLTQMELQIDVDEADVGKVREGQAAVFTVDAYPDREFPAETVQVRFSPETSEGVVTYKTVLHVDNSDLTLRPGMTATAVLTVDSRQDVLVISNAALRFSPPVVEAPDSSGGGSILSRILPHPPARKPIPRVEAGANGREQAVWTLRDGDLTPVTISKGVSDGTFTEVLEGALEPGTAVVTDTLGSTS
jgi:HlyD family secretion protein